MGFWDEFFRLNGGSTNSTGFRNCIMMRSWSFLCGLLADIHWWSLATGFSFGRLRLVDFGVWRVWWFWRIIFCQILPRGIRTPPYLRVHLELFLAWESLYTLVHLTLTDIRSTAVAPSLTDASAHAPPVHFPILVMPYQPVLTNLIRARSSGGLSLRSAGFQNHSRFGIVEDWTHDYIVSGGAASH